MKRVLIIGGGISGLATAYSLQRLSTETDLPIRGTVIERSNAFGGKITTYRQDGFVIEGGPDSFLAQKPYILALCNELGLADRLVPPQPIPRGTRVLHRGRLVAVPDGVMLVAPTKLWPFVKTPLFSWLGKLRMGMDLLIPPRRSDADESVASFIRRRLGSEALDRLAQPLMAGIHVADPERLSMQAAFPRLVLAECQHGGLIRGLRAQPKPGPAAKPGSGSGFLTLSGGMGELIDALTARLDPEMLCSGQEARRLEADRTADQPRFRITLEDGTDLVADAVVLATPANVTAKLVSTLSPELASALGQIRYVSTATISLGYRRPEVQGLMQGSGFVVPRSEGRAITAVTWSSAKFADRAPADQILLRAFIGGDGKQQLVELDESALIQLVRTELQGILGIVGEPTIAKVFRWPEAIPQYDVGHIARISALEGLLPPGIFLVGAAYHGVGIPDCAITARETAQKVASYLTDAVTPSLAGRI